MVYEPGLAILPSSWSRIAPHHPAFIFRSLPLSLFDPVLVSPAKVTLGELLQGTNIMPLKA